MRRVRQLHSTARPEVHEIAADMRAIADSYAGNGLVDHSLTGFPVDRIAMVIPRQERPVPPAVRQRAGQ